MNKKYGPFEVHQFPKKLAEKPSYKKDVLAVERRIMDEYKFTLEQMHYLIKQKPSILLLDDDYQLDKRGLKALKELLVDEMGLELKEFRRLVLNHPAVLNKTRDEMKATFAVMQEHKIHKQEGLKIITEMPKVLSYDIKKRLDEITFYFNLYNGFELEDTAKIFRGFPFIVCLPDRKLTLFAAEFKKLMFSKELIIKVCTQSGGILACDVSNFKGVFDTLRSFGITAEDTKGILDALPEFALLNRKDLLREKITLIERESGRGRSYIRNFVKRHPDILMR